MGTLIGADPEFFVERDGKIVPVFGLLGGSKSKPRTVRDGALQEDNVLAEINIKPAATAMDFIRNIGIVRQQLDEVLNPYHSLVASTHFFEEDILLNNPQSFAFGCEPDLNCWTQQPNIKPSPVTTMRSAGGHVHIGYDNPTPEKSFAIAAMCDIFMGIPSVMLDEDRQRRSLYGKAGACRIKPYGVEYRALSNFWLGSPMLMYWVFNTAVSCANTSHKLQSIMEYIDPTKVQRIINEYDKDEAVRVVKDLKITIPRGPSL